MPPVELLNSFVLAACALSEFFKRSVDKLVSKADSSLSQTSQITQIYL